MISSSKAASLHIMIWSIVTRPAPVQPQNRPQIAHVVSKGVPKSHRTKLQGTWQTRPGAKQQPSPSMAMARSIAPARPDFPTARPDFPTARSLAPARSIAPVRPDFTTAHSLEPAHSIAPARRLAPTRSIAPARLEFTPARSPAPARPSARAQTEPNGSRQAPTVGSQPQRSAVNAQRLLHCPNGQKRLEDSPNG